MQLTKHNIETLIDVETSINILNEQEFTTPIDLLSGSSIGQHIRHIIEFYDCIFKPDSGSVISYDNRKRDVRIETDPYFALQKTDEIKKHLGQITEDKKLIFVGNYSTNEQSKTVFPTSLYRELAYALDHTIHHLAIVKIGLSVLNKQVHENFGVAPSTIRNRKLCVR